MTKKQLLKNTMLSSPPRLSKTIKNLNIPFFKEISINLFRIPRLFFKAFLLKHDMFAFILIISVKTRQKVLYACSTIITIH